MAARRVHGPSCSTSRSTYQVFLSFRGKDTRTNFTDHLYTALKQAGIHTFRDDDEIERGENIELEIERAIQESKMSIIVFSKDYATSRWCLDELVMIMKRRETNKHFVLPVFYHVDPSHVSEQSNSYADAFAAHEKMFKEEMHMVNGWRAALREVADLGGMVLKDGSEAQFIKGIVKKVERKISSKLLPLSPYLVGVDSHVERINLWLHHRSNDVGIAVIHGVGGVGKTTIAKIVHNLNYDQFEGVSFLENIRETSKQPNGLVHLQRQLLSEIRKEETNIIYSVGGGIREIKGAVCCKKVLIFLDDVDELEQFEAIIGMSSWLYQGSRVIVTTRRECLLKSHEECVKFKIEPLDDDKSFQLFCWHAFGQMHPVEDYARQSKRVVHYCGGLPLALKILGSSLSCNHELWKIALQEPKGIDIDDKIEEILRISYESVRDDCDKNLFLDIACFFIGKNKDMVEKIVEDCYLYRTGGIQRLINQCLVTIDKDNKLMMHQLLRDMGREIDHRKSPENLGERSRLWHHRDVLTVLKDNSGTDKVKGLALDMHSLMEEKNNTVVVSGGAIKMKTKAFTKISNLRFLQLNYAKLKGSYENFPKSLIWLCWHGFPLKSIPKDFCLEKLIVLDIRNSKLINVWEGRKSLQLLKILDLSHSHSLVRTPDFSQVTRLEWLILADCINLVQLHESIGHLKGLLLLNLRDCISLRKLPNNICMLESLQEIMLAGCSNLHETSVHQLQSTTMVRHSSSWSLLPLRKTPKSITFSVSVFPRSLGKLSLKGCSISDDAILNGLTCLPLLKGLDLSGNPITTLPESIKTFTMLNVLCLFDCKRLQSLPELPTKLFLAVLKCDSLQRISNLPQILSVRDCDKLIEVQDWIKEELLKHVSIEMIFLMLTILADTAMKSTWIEVYVYECGKFSIIFPGSEVPSWFNHQVESLSFSYDVPLLLGHKVCGITLCVVYSLTSGSTIAGAMVSACIIVETKGLTFWIECYTSPIEQGGGDMLWFSHWKSVDQLETGDEVKVWVFTKSIMEVKRCGIHFMYGKEEKGIQSNNEEIAQNSTLLDQSVSDEDFSVRKAQIVSTFPSSYICTFRTHFPDTSYYYKFKQYIERS